MYLTKWYFLKKNEKTKYLVYFSKPEPQDIFDIPNLIKIDNNILNYYTKKVDNQLVLHIHSVEKTIKLRCLNPNRLSKFLLNISIYLSGCSINPDFETKSKEDLIAYCNKINIESDQMTYQNIAMVLDLPLNNKTQLENTIDTNTLSTITDPKTITSIPPKNTTPASKESIEADIEDDLQSMVSLNTADSTTAELYQLL